RKASVDERYGMASYFPDGYALAVIGAGSGIGKAAALAIANDGAAVACLDRDGQAADAVAAEIAGRGGRAIAVTADVTAEATVISGLARTERELAPLQALVNCAGITGRTNIKGHEVDLDDFDLVYRINLRGAMVVSKAVLPLMLARNYGRL